MDLQVLLEMAVASDPARVAVTGSDGRSLTTSELEGLAHGAARRFSESGASHVAFCGTNGVALPVVLFGATIARLPFLPINYRLADAQLRQIVRDHDLVAVAEGSVAQRLDRLGVAALVEPGELLESGIQNARCAGDGVNPDHVALLLYTSGTTAAPKAAVLRHRHIASYVIGTVEFASADPADACLLSLPPYHIAGIMNLLTNLYMGRRIVYLDPFDPEGWLELVRRESITHAMVVPTMLARIVACLDGEPADVPSLRTLSYGGAKMPESVIRQALRLFGRVQFANAYGLTETSSTITILGPEDHRQAIASDDDVVRARLRSAGRPVPGIEIEVRNEGGTVCPPGEVGDIFVRGDQVAGEYVGGETPGVEWFATRDRGHIDAAGYLFVDGRSDDTIIRGGENIAPAEIEDVLLRNEHVNDCAVVGIDDEEWGQRIAAAVVLREGARVSTEDLRRFAREHLRGSKTPDVIVVLEALPYTDTGKLLRRSVRDQLAQVTAPSSSPRSPGSSGP